MTNRGTKMKQYPPELYVEKVRDGDGPHYFNASEKSDALAEVGEKKIIGVYQLVRTIEITTEVKQRLVSEPKSRIVI